MLRWSVSWPKLWRNEICVGSETGVHVVLKKRRSPFDPDPTHQNKRESVMRFLLEKALLCSVYKEAKGESFDELGVEIPLDRQGFWDDTEATMQYHLYELLEQIADRYRDWRRKTKDHDKYFVYFGYHITDRPMTWDECDELYTATVLGAPVDVSVYHSYSDLTGYLWTNVYVKNGEGHDVHKEIAKAFNQGRKNWDDKRYLCMKFEITKK